MSLVLVACVVLGCTIYFGGLRNALERFGLI
jgi:high-affinity Fe2+/Pb2+ permease